MTACSPYKIKWHTFMTSTFNFIKQGTDFFLCNCDNYCTGKQPKSIQLALYKDFSCQMITREENQSTHSTVKMFNQFKVHQQPIFGYLQT
jgi:hypothetical protein